MAFEYGNKLSTGRPAGALNVRSKRFIEILEKNQFCVASSMLELYKISMTQFIEELEKTNAGTMSPMESSAPKYLKLCADLLMALAGYAYPKLKAIEQTNPGAMEGMTPEQRIRAAEAAVEMLKLQAKNSGT